MGQLGEARLDTTPLVAMHDLPPIVRSARLAAKALMRDCWSWGAAGEELLGETRLGAAGCRPNLDCWPRAAAEAARHDLNAIKQHRLRTHRDAGCERASDAAGQGKRQLEARACTSRRHWSWTRNESRASSGPGP